jgi:hypothetical protein
MAVTADQVITAYLKLRDERSEAKKAFEAEDKARVDKMDRLEVWLLTKMDEVGTEQLKGGDAIAFVSSSSRANCADWGTFWAFLSEEGRLDMLEKRVSSKTVMEYYKETGQLPPGLNLSTERTVNIRRV